MRYSAIILLAAAAGAAMALSACTSAPKPQASSPPPAVAPNSGSSAAGAAMNTASDVGDAAEEPLRDLNLMHDQIPPALIRAYARPYDQSGMDTCPAIADQIHQLDLALGPDVDIPQAASPEKDMFNKGASLAADAALEAVRSATGGVIPVRSWVRRFSGAARAEQEAKAVALAGSVRRGYLKALGQMKGCDWPASPLAPQVYQARVAAAQAAAAAANANSAPQSKQ